MHRTVPFFKERYNLAPAAIMPSKTGGESSLYSASFVPSETETARSIVPHHNDQISEIVDVGQSPSGPTLH